MHIVDLSRPIENSPHSDPPGLTPTVQYLAHGDTVDMMLGFFPGVTRDQLPGGEGWATEVLTLSTHSGTHMDAPWHYHSTMDGGKPATTIEQMPLEWCIGPGVKLDFRGLPDGYVATAGDVERELERIGHALKPGDIVLVNTRAGDAWGREGYVSAGCGLGREATLYLTERGVKVVGTDAWSWDAPFEYTSARVVDTGDVSLIWEGHRAGMARGYYQMEKLGHLEKLPGDGFTVFCFPVNVKGASAGWCRPVAIFDFELPR